MTFAPTSTRMTRRRVLASIPSPPVSYIDLGPLRIHIYALCIIAGIIVAVLLTNCAPDQARRRAVGRDRHLAVAVPLGDHRRAASTTCSPTPTTTSARAPTSGRSSASGRAASRSTARSSAARSAPGSAAGGPASGSGRSPTRSRPACCSPRRSAASATGSTRSCSACRPTCPGASRSTATTPRSRRASPPARCSTRRSSTR